MLQWTHASFQVHKGVIKSANHVGTTAKSTATSCIPCLNSWVFLPCTERLQVSIIHIICYEWLEVFLSLTLCLIWWPSHCRGEQDPSPKVSIIHHANSSIFNQVPFYSLLATYVAILIVWDSCNRSLMWRQTLLYKTRICSVHGARLKRFCRTRQWHRFAPYFPTLHLIATMLAPEHNW